MLKLQHQKDVTTLPSSHTDGTQTNTPWEDSNQTPPRGLSELHVPQQAQSDAGEAQPRCCGGELTTPNRGPSVRSG